jgi:CheY-like chemotaxis protein
LTGDAGAPGAPLRVLVVLPSPPLRLLAAAALRAALARTGRDARTTEAGSAFDALWLLARGRPDLALVALDLPILSGDELVALLRARPEHRELPVVAVAPAADSEAPRRAAAAGVAALLTTPFDVDAVEAALAAAGLSGRAE